MALGQKRRKKMRHLREAKGFTLIELVIIILVLGILAATAVPRFIDMRNEANAAAEKGIVGGVRGGIAILYASNVLASSSGTWPTVLDGQANGPNPSGTFFFSSVLDPGVDDGKWTKSTLTYTGPTGTTYTYNPATGAFVSP